MNGARGHETHLSAPLPHAYFLGQEPQELLPTQQNTKHKILKLSVVVILLLRLLCFCDLDKLFYLSGALSVNYR